MSKRYVAQWRKRYRKHIRRRYRKRETISTTGLIFKAARLYKLGVKNNDRQALLEAQRLIDKYDRYTEYMEQMRRR